MNNLLNKFLFWISGYLRCRLIKIEGWPYLERYYVGTVFGRHVYLHRFLASDDPKQGVHDHPWLWSMSFILCGWYIEHRRWDTGTPKKWFNWIGADHFHLVILPPNIYVWSLFVAGPAKPGRVWGMLRQVAPYEDSDTRGDAEFVFIPYDYGAPGHNPPPGKWWHCEPFGRFQAREERDYVRT